MLYSCQVFETKRHNVYFHWSCICFFPFRTNVLVKWAAQALKTLTSSRWKHHMLYWLFLILWDQTHSVWRGGVFVMSVQHLNTLHVFQLCPCSNWESVMWSPGFKRQWDIIVVLLCFRALDAEQSAVIMWSKYHILSPLEKESKRRGKRERDRQKPRALLGLVLHHVLKG